MLTSINIVLVEDNFSLRDLMLDHLLQLGYRAVGFSCAEELDDYLVTCHVDVVVLDVNLPGEDGFSIAKRLSAASPNLYIIMLTAMSRDREKILGYESGADIYLIKPASAQLLASAIASVERRIRLRKLGFSGVLVDEQKLMMMGPLGAVHLGAFHVGIIKALAAAPNQKLDYWRLLEIVEKEPTEKNKIALGVQIFRLKQKLRQVTDEAYPIRAIFKEGYQLTIPISLI